MTFYGFRFPPHIWTPQGQSRRNSSLQRAAADLVGSGSHLSERSAKGAPILLPRLQRLSTGANYSPHDTSQQKRCSRMCSAPPRAAERVAPPEGNICGKSQISRSEGAGRTAGSGLRWHSLGGDTMRLREHLVQALSPPASPAAPPPATSRAIFAVFGSRFKKVFPRDLTSIFSALRARKPILTIQELA